MQAIFICGECQRLARHPLISLNKTAEGNESVKNNAETFG